LIIFPGGNLYELIACEKINNSNNIWLNISFK
jgi:hypothetical protein